MVEVRAAQEREQEALLVQAVRAPLNHGTDSLLRHQIKVAQASNEEEVVVGRIRNVGPPFDANPEWYEDRHDIEDHTF